MAPVRSEDREVLRAKSGVVLTGEGIEELSQEAEAGYDLTKARRERVGRPTLDEGVSPRVSFRTSRKLYDAARARAKQEGRTVSELARGGGAVHLPPLAPRSSSGTHYRENNRVMSDRNVVDYGGANQVGAVSDQAPGEQGAEPLCRRALRPGVSRAATSEPGWRRALGLSRGRPSRDRVRGVGRRTGR